MAENQNATKLPEINSSVSLLTNEFLDLEPIHIPPPSRLYYLEPMGIGTIYTESMTSYVTRLAAEHCLNVRTLVQREILPLFKREYLIDIEGRKLTGTFWKTNVRALNGTHTWASDWLKSLEILTLRNDLRFLTMLMWKEVLSPRGLLRSIKAWCPNCYADWRDMKKNLYEPLIWLFNMVELCPYHRCYLVLQCPHCNRSQPLLTPKSMIGSCSYCQGWLGVSSPGSVSKLPDEDKLEWQNWVTNALGGLISNAPSLSCLPKRENISIAINHYVDYLTDGNASAFAREMGLSLRTVRDLQNGTQIPTISTLLLIGGRLGLSLNCFTMGEITEVGREQAISMPQDGLEHNSTIRYRVLDLPKLRNYLEAVIQNEAQPPPPMEQVAKQLGYDQSHIRKHFPDLCASISAQHLKYIRKKREIRQQEGVKEIYRIVNRMKDQGQHPSCDNVKTFLKPGSMREPMFIAAWRRAVRDSD